MGFGSTSGLDFSNLPLALANDLDPFPNYSLNDKCYPEAPLWHPPFGTPDFFLRDALPKIPSHTLPAFADFSVMGRMLHLIETLEC